MRTFTKWVLLIVIASLVAVLPLQAQKDGGKANVFHKGKFISVSWDAVPAHVGHGDPAPYCKVDANVPASLSISGPSSVVWNTSGSWTFKNTTGSKIDYTVTMNGVPMGGGQLDAGSTSPPYTYLALRDVAIQVVASAPATYTVILTITDPGGSVSHQASVAKGGSYTFIGVAPTLLGPPTTLSGLAEVTQVGADIVVSDVMSNVDVSFTIGGGE